MADDFYSRWFSRTQPLAHTPKRLWKREKARLRHFATSEMAQRCIETFAIPEVDETQEAFEATLAGVPDLEPRNLIDWRWKKSHAISNF